MRYLITGGAGFVGTNLVRRLAADPAATITVLDSLDPRFQSTLQPLAPIRERINFVHGDVCDEPLVARLVCDQDIVVHCAGQTSHSMSMQNPLLDAQINCLGTLRLLESLRRHNPRAVAVLASTTTVAGRSASANEPCGDQPLDIYSANNGAAENYFRIYHHAHGLPTVCIRLPNLYGPFGKADPQFGFVNFFLAQAIDGQVLPVFGDGRQQRNVMFVEDAVEVLLLAAGTPALHGGTWVAASDEHLSVLQIAEQIVETVGRGSVQHVDWPEDRKRIESGSVLIDAGQLRATTGWTARFHFASGLRKTLELLQLSAADGP